MHRRVRQWVAGLDTLDILGWAAGAVGFALIYKVLSFVPVLGIWIWWLLVLRVLL